MTESEVAVQVGADVVVKPKRRWVELAMGYPWGVSRHTCC